MSLPSLGLSRRSRSWQRWRRGPLVGHAPLEAPPRGRGPPSPFDLRGRRASHLPTPPFLISFLSSPRVTGWHLPSSRHALNAISNDRFRVLSYWTGSASLSIPCKGGEICEKASLSTTHLGQELRDGTNHPQSMLIFSPALTGQNLEHAHRNRQNR